MTLEYLSHIEYVATAQKYFEIEYKLLVFIHLS